jgi:putative DNA primase/helicase
MNLPPELTDRPQWLIWRREKRKDSTKLTKVPYQCKGYQASTTNKRHWSTFGYALEVWLKQRIPCDGIGFVFTAEDPFCGIDIDNCWLSDAAETPTWAAGIERRFYDTYREESPSGMGFKIFCRAKAPLCKPWKITPTGQIEIYDRSRVFCSHR